MNSSQARERALSLSLYIHSIVTDYVYPPTSTACCLQVHRLTSLARTKRNSEIISCWFFFCFFFFCVPPLFISNKGRFSIWKRLPLAFGRDPHPHPMPPPLRPSPPPPQSPTPPIIVSQVVPSKPICSLEFNKPSLKRFSLSLSLPSFCMPS